MNSTAIKFGDPETRIKAYDHWVILLRPEQVTLGSLVLVCTEPVQQFSAASEDAFVELRVAINDAERVLDKAFQYDKINYLMLMMVDPDVHFHIFPRYSSIRIRDDVEFRDHGWPGPPTLANANKINQKTNLILMNEIKQIWYSL